jgi:hypothetical protein
MWGWLLLGFAPLGSDDTPGGERVRRTHAAEQARLGAAPAWRHFIDGEGRGWTARFDEAAHVPVALRGPGIPLGATEDASSVGAAVLAWVERHRPLLGLHPDDALAVSDSRPWTNGRAWFVDIERSRDDVPVHRGGLTASIRDGRLSLLKSGATGSAPVRGTLLLSASTAMDIAANEGPAGGTAHSSVSARPVLVPRRDRDGLALLPAWEVSSRTADPPGDWRVFVHGASGAILGVENDVRMLDGTVTAMHHARNPSDPLTEVAVQEAWVESGDRQTSTAEDGTFTLDVDGTWSVRLHGDWLDVDNAAGPDAQPETDGDSIVVSAANAHLAEIDAWVHAQHMRDWGLAVDADVPMSVFEIDAIVNLKATCNAFYDGNINFYVAGDGCNNTAMVADVVYHEWGHGFHFWSNPYGLFDGSLSEGASDVVAFLQTGDNIIAPFFFTNGGGIRDVSPNRSYPDDYVPSYYYVHSNGLIFGGAMWDLWQILKDEVGDEEAQTATEQILAGVLKAGATIESSYDDAVFADDDNGTLADGTPHLCAIIDAFGAHGLGPGDAGVFLLSGHAPVEWGAANTPTDLRVDLADAGDCIQSTAESAWVTWRADGGDWVTTDLNVAGQTITGSIPAQPDGAIVEYWLSITDPTGAVADAPAGGEIQPYSFYVGDVIDVLCEDFEDDDGGFTHELIAGTDQLGADDWMWGAPQGAGGDPEAAFSGASAWGNDLALEYGWDGQYQDNKKNKLTGVDWDVAPYTGVFLRYRRWLGVEDSAYDDAVIRADGDVVWRNFSAGDGEGHHIDSGWAAHVVSLKGAADDGSVALAFSLDSDEGLHFGGWTIDDVCLHAPATPDNRLAITDFTATPDGPLVGLSWTQPRLGPLDEVVVVRRSDTWPTGHDDGTVVHRDQAPEVAAAAFAVDPGNLGLGYYAVYARSGDHWLSWTLQGFNADDAVGNGIPGLPGAGGGTDGLPLDGSACACATGAVPQLPLVGLLAIVLRRRRST